MKAIKILLAAGLVAGLAACSASSYLTDPSTISTGISVEPNHVDSLSSPVDSAVMNAAVRGTQGFAAHR